MTTEPLHAPSIDPEEAACFEKLAHRSRYTEGPFWPRHKRNAFCSNCSSKNRAPFQRFTPCGVQQRLPNTRIDEEARRPQAVAGLDDKSGVVPLGAGVTPAAA
jgi:hypothetical protein